MTPPKILSDSLHGVWERMHLCSLGLDEAPSYVEMHHVIRRCLPTSMYFVWAHHFDRSNKPSKEVSLIIYEEDQWAAGIQLSERVLIFDSRKPQLTPNQLCEWFFIEYEKVATKNSLAP